MEFGPVRELKRDLLFLLHDVARLLRIDADKRASAHGMTRAQWGILIWLERQPGITQKELAELLEVEPMTVARLVERRPDPRDRRIWRLHLRPEAHPMLREIECQRSEIACGITAGLEPEAVETLIGALQHIKSTLLRDAQSRREAAVPAREVA